LPKYNFDKAIQLTDKKHFFSIFAIINYKIMLTKDKVRKTVDRLPENFTVDQIVEELMILNRIEEGLKDIDEGRVFTTDQVKKELKTWLK
jgi:predicted transcriptional regulator